MPEAATVRRPAARFLLQWLEKQAGAKAKSDADLTAENEKLKQEIETLKGSPPFFAPAAENI